MRSSEALFILLAVASGCAAAPKPEGQQGWVEDGVRVRDEPWRAHDGPFLAALILTDDAGTLYERWNTQPGNLKTLNTHEAAPGANVQTAVFFSRCKPDQDGNCQIWGAATVEADDGRVLARVVEVPLWVGRPPPPDPALGISEHGVGLVVDEAVSTYLFRMIVSDRVAGREVRLVESLTVRHRQ